MKFLIELDRLGCRCKNFMRSGSKPSATLALILGLSLSACSTISPTTSNGNSGSSPTATKPARPSAGTAADARNSESRSADAKSSDGKPVEHKANEGKHSESRSSEAKSVEVKPAEPGPIPGKPALTGTIDGIKSGTQAAETSAVARTPARDSEYGMDEAQAAIVVSPQPPLTEKDLWNRIRKGFALPALSSPLVADKEKFYLQQPEYLDRMMTRGGRYLFHIVEEVEKRGLPTELALLPFVESAMNPVAMSSARASGLWQFMPATGKFFNLSQNWWVDDRRDVVHSTRAALDYLQKLHAMHGKDWFLALASYNWGEGAVGRSVRKNRERGRPTDYLSLDMPNETRHYIPKLMAMKNIIANASERGLTLPNLPNKPYFVTIEKTRPIDLKLAAQFAGMTIDEFVALNPAHNRPVIAATKNNEIKLPADRLDAFVDAVTKHDQSKKTFASWQPYTLKDGETLDNVAQRGGVSVAELQKANSLKQTTKVLPGTNLLAPQLKPVADERKVEAFVAPRVYEQVNNPAVHHTVGKRDSLASIARRYGVSPNSISAMNGQKKIARGTTLLVRPASSHTLLTTEHGERQVLAARTSAHKSAPDQQGEVDKSTPVSKKAGTKPDSRITTKARARIVKQSRQSNKAAVRPVAARGATQGIAKHSAKPPRASANSVVETSSNKNLVKASGNRKPVRG